MHKTVPVSSSRKRALASNLAAIRATRFESVKAILIVWEYGSISDTGLLVALDFLTQYPGNAQLAIAAGIRADTKGKVMYEVQFRRFYTRTGDFTPIKRGLLTLAEAKAAREVSGDLVVESATDRIVTDKSWLWDYELADERSYAHAAIIWQAQAKQPIE